MIGVNIIGFAFALLARRFQGISSQHARDTLIKAFFEAFVNKDGHFEENVSLADTYTVASQGIDSLDTYYSHYLSLQFRTLFNCSNILIIILAFFSKVY